MLLVETLPFLNKKCNNSSKQNVSWPRNNVLGGVEKGIESEIKAAGLVHRSIN